MRPGVVVLCNARSIYACLRLNMLVRVSPSVLRVLQACPRNNGPPTSAFCTGSEFIITSCPSPHPSLPSLRRQLVLHSPLWLSASLQPYPRSSPSSLSLVSPPDHPSLRTLAISGLDPCQLRPINGSPSYSTCTYTAASFPRTRLPPRLLGFAPPHSNKTGGFLYLILTVPLTLPHPPRFPQEDDRQSTTISFSGQAGAILSSYLLPS